MKRHYVYLLKSTTTNKTYIGYTSNINKRLRQHNGEISGGAKSTLYGRPWIFVCYITGFPDKSTALKFEWRNHHPLKSWTRKKGSINNRLFILRNALLMDKFTSSCIPSNLYNLIIIWKDPLYLEYWKK